MNAKNPIVLSALGVVIAGFVFFHFALQPKQKQAAKLKTQVTESQAKLDAAKTLLASNLQARVGFRTAYSTVVRLGKAVPGDDDVRSLVVQLDHAAKKTSVDFQSIDVGGASGAAAPTPAAAPGAPAAAAVQLPPGATVGPAGFPVMPFSFGFRGQFFRLGKFFERLDAFVKATNKRTSVTGRLLTIDALKLEPDTTGFPNIKATVTATSYLVSPLEGMTGGATPAGPAGATNAAGTPPAAGGSTPTTTTATSTGAIG